MVSMCEDAEQDPANPANPAAHLEKSMTYGKAIKQPNPAEDPAPLTPSRRVPTDDIMEFEVPSFALQRIGDRWLLRARVVDPFLPTVVVVDVVDKEALEGLDFTWPSDCSSQDFRASLSIAWSKDDAG